MATIENKGYFARDEDLEKYIAKFNYEYPYRSHVKALIIKIFAVTNDLELPVDSIWFRKSIFFTLTIEIAKNQGKIPNDFRYLLIRLEEKILNNKKKLMTLAIIINVCTQKQTMKNLEL